MGQRGGIHAHSYQGRDFPCCYDYPVMTSPSTGILRAGHNGGYKGGEGGATTGRAIDYERVSSLCVALCLG